MWEHEESVQSASGDDFVGASASRGCLTDEASGKLASRPGWNECMSFLRQGDVLVAVKLDRFGRSVANLIATTQELERRGVDIVAWISQSTPERPPASCGSR